jgi:hypothetical protein
MPRAHRRRVAVKGRASVKSELNPFDATHRLAAPALEIGAPVGISAQLVAKPSDPIAVVVGDGQTTLGDLGAFLHDAYFLPGDWLIWVVASYLPSLATTLDIGAHDYRGLFSAFVSTLAWLTLLVVAGATYQGIRDADCALTRALVNAYAATLRRIRMESRLLVARLRARPKQAPSEVEFSEELELTSEELRALQLHAELGPGYAMPVSEVASALDARIHKAEVLLARLKKLQLLDTTAGGCDGEDTYVLTRTGRGFLLFKQLAARR